MQEKQFIKFREHFRKAWESHPPAHLPREEWKAHFRDMPLRYWAHIDTEALEWHLKGIHAFFENLSNHRKNPMEPVVSWRVSPDKNHSEVAICTWDRQGLCAKIAGAFALAGINILSADIHTRGDHVVLDLFRVCDAKTRKSISSNTRKLKMQKILREALRDGHSLSIRQKFHQKQNPRRRPTGPPPCIQFDNRASDTHTLMKIDCQDSVGLLFHILDILTDNRVDVAQAELITHQKRVECAFHLRDGHHRKISDSLILHSIQDQLGETLHWLASQ